MASSYLETYVGKKKLGTRKHKFRHSNVRYSPIFAREVTLYLQEKKSDLKTKNLRTQKLRLKKKKVSWETENI